MKSILTSLAALTFPFCVSANPSFKKVEELVRKRDRSAAINHLVESIEKAKGKPKELAMLIEKLGTVSEMFFSDEGQRAYESALSLSFYSPKEAKTKAEEALKFEPSNILILKLLANLEYKRLNCEGAEKRLAEIPVQTFRESEIAYQAALRFYCDSDSRLEIKDKRLDFPNKVFFLGLDSLRANNTEKARGFLTQSIDKDPKFAEAYYWLWKLDETKTEIAEKYVQLCKTPDKKMLRNYKDFPFLCNNISEVPNLEVKDEI